MSPAAKRIVRESAAFLNDGLDNDPRIKQILDHKEADYSVLELVNDLLESIADGGRVIVARETDGSMVGFVPKSDIPTRAAGASKGGAGGSEEIKRTTTPGVPAIPGAA